MRVFVLGTGRCGTVTFSKACEHIENYTVGHESHAGRVGDFNYPDDHIEVDSRLVECIAHLLVEYPDAFFVQLMRSRDDCVASMARRPKQDMYCRLHFAADPDRYRAAQVRYFEYNTRIQMMIPDAYIMWLESAPTMWPEFWSEINADGDFEASLAEWDTRYNATVPEGKVSRIGDSPT